MQAEVASSHARAEAATRELEVGLHQAAQEAHVKVTAVSAELHRAHTDEAETRRQYEGLIADLEGKLGRAMQELAPLRAQGDVREAYARLQRSFEKLQADCR